MINHRRRAEDYLADADALEFQVKEQRAELAANADTGGGMERLLRHDKISRRIIDLEQQLDRAIARAQVHANLAAIQ